MIETNNVVVISDTHCGCQLGLCPPGGIRLDEGGTYRSSRLQRKLWAMWEEFWNEYVPEATRGEPYVIVFNGDAIDGVHHNSVTQITNNLKDQSKIAEMVLRPLVTKKNVQGYFHVRGTEAHVGKSGQEEERLAEKIGSIPNREGQYARYDLWKRIGPGKLIHALHHIGTTGSQAYEVTAVGKELVEEFAEAGRWRNEPPDVVVRSHRHRYSKTSVPVGHKGRAGKQHTGEAISVVTPAWQGKTPFVWRMAGGRLSTPQFGGILIRWADDELFVRSKVWTVDRSPTE